MARPVVLVATTDPTMAYALGNGLDEPCRRRGLRLEICPGGDGDEQDFGGKKVRAYSCAEALFDHLETVSRDDPMGLADTLVVLDVGANLTQAFEPAAPKDNGWHKTESRRAGVAVELILRFPQVFPVFLSPAVPVDQEASNPPSAMDVCYPKSLSEYRGGDGGWTGFDQLRESFCTRHRRKSGSEAEPLCKENTLWAFHAPLHFVSPLDGGRGLRSMLARFARGMRCWFDPTGLRTLVKNRFLGTLFDSNDNWDNTASQREFLLERLGRVAVAVDEEREFAMLNAYAAYKFGRRAWIVTTFAEFNDNPLWVARSSQRELNVVVLRDVDLRFSDLPDKDESFRDGLLSVKSEIWKTIDDKLRLGSSAQWRVRVVSSNPDVKETACWWNSEDERLGERDGQYLGLTKPIASLYELQRLLRRSKDEKSCSVLSSLESVPTKSSSSRHGAPYLNLAMAESLLQQAKRCEDGPMAHVLGALLAGEAYELLLGMSKTTALEALLAQHKKEVAAEVEFPGVAHGIDIKPRQKDIGVTLKKLTRTNSSISMHNKSVQHMFLSQFWAELKAIYRNGEQFVAAEMANKQSLIYGNYFKNVFGDTVWKTIKRVLVPIATSFGWWTVASLASIVLSTIGYACVSDKGFGELVLSTALSSITLQPTSFVNGILNEPNWQQLIVGIIHMSLSYLLFGVLISMLYRKVTRG